MKYIDAEKLIAEIGSRMEDCKLPDGTFPTTTNIVRYEELSCLRNFITSLQQEQPDNEDVDKVAQELYEHLYELKRRNNVPTNLYDKKEIIDLWKAGIVYGRSHPKQEQPEVECEDLEEAAKHYSEHTSFHWPNQVKPSYDAFKAGAEWQYQKDKTLIKKAHDCGFGAGSVWQKAKMMENAVEGEVCGRVKDHINVRFPDGLCKYLEPKNISHIPADVKKYEVGDKVRVIIVKEEEQ